MASSGCKVQRGAQLAVEQVGITVALLQQQLCCFDFPVPGWDQTKLHHDSSPTGQTWIHQTLSDLPAGVVNGSPVVAVKLLDGEAAVQKLREQLGVSFTGAAVEGKVVHPLALPAEIFVHMDTFLQTLDAR